MGRSLERRPGRETERAAAIPAALGASLRLGLHGDAVVLLPLRVLLSDPGRVVPLGRRVGHVADVERDFTDDRSNIRRLRHGQHALLLAALGVARVAPHKNVLLVQAGRREQMTRARGGVRFTGRRLRLGPGPRAVQGEIAGMLARLLVRPPERRRRAAFIGCAVEDGRLPLAPLTTTFLRHVHADPCTAWRVAVELASHLVRLLDALTVGDPDRLVDGRRPVEPAFLDSFVPEPGHDVVRRVPLGRGPARVEVLDESGSSRLGVRQIAVQRRLLVELQVPEEVLGKALLVLLRRAREGGDDVGEAPHRRRAAPRPALLWKCCGQPVGAPS